MIRFTTFRHVFVLFLIPLTFSFLPSAHAQSNDSLDIKIGQMLLVGFRGLSVNSQSTVVKDIQQRHIGGVVLFDYDVPSKSPVRNIKSPQQVKKLVSDLKSYTDIPLFVSIDQEGGQVARLKPKFGFDPTVSEQYLGKLNDLDSTRYYARKTAQTLDELGINVDFAPVVDLNVNPDNPIIGKIGRSYSANPEVVTRNARASIEVFNKQGILSVIKHFPGHGSSKSDTHLGMADVTDTWSRKELIPYKRLINSGDVDMIMTAHIFNSNLDPKYPATLSKPVLTGILRDSLGYDGVVFSDDMQMNAIRSFYGLEKSIQLAINAGIDILTFGNNLVYDEHIATKITNIMKKLVNEGKISRQRIDESYDRIMKMKKRLGDNY